MCDQSGLKPLHRLYYLMSHCKSHVSRGFANEVMGSIVGTNGVHLFIEFIYIPLTNSLCNAPLVRSGGKVASSLFVDST